ncbi:MAG: TnpV protein [Oscillospiraceae bacterium]
MLSAPLPRQKPLQQPPRRRGPHRAGLSTGAALLITARAARKTERICPLARKQHMLWIQRMNNIRSAAMEIVANDLIYC